MLAVDTNVLVRLLVRDDEPQFKAAYMLVHEHNIHVPDSVILEAEWVLRYAYDYAPVEVCFAFRRLLGLTNVNVENPARLAKILDWHEGGMDFADALHLAKSEHLSGLKTFDEKFIKRAKGLTECRVTGL